MDPGLVYDVGLHDGADTAYYLSRGYRVVAIDADLRAVERARTAHARAVRDGRLTLLPCAVGAAEGDVDFHLSENTLWNSVQRPLADRHARYATTVRVPCRRLGDLMAEHGVPFYCKIDVEGCDADCLATLERLPERPRYLSVETESVGPGERLGEAETVATLAGLRRLGYRRFKLVDQRSLAVLSPTRPVYRDRPPLWKRLRRRLGLGGYGPYNYACWHPEQRRRVCEAAGYDFPPHASGPFGADLGGAWADFATARAMLLRHRRDYFRLSRAESFGFWCDWHATV